MEYREIKLAVGVRLYKKDGSFNKTVKNGLDALADRLIENGHEVVNEYNSVKEKVLIDFKCGHPPHPISADNYKNGNGCPKCSGKCTEQAKDDLSRLIESNGHELLSEYVDAKTKILVDFKCGHDSHLMKPNDYKKGIGCSKCSGKCPEKAKEELIRLIESNGHEWIEGEYINTHTKILIDFKCDHKSNWITPNAYKRGNGCLKCSGRCPEQAKEDLINLISSNGHIWVEGEYINTETKICIDFKCGHESHYISPDSYKNGTGCPKCADISTAEKRSEKAKEEFLAIVYRNGHELLSEYIGSAIKVLINFKCGHEAHWIQPNNYKHGQGCPICNESKGEKRVRKWLDENNYTFKSQKEFDGLIGTGGGNLSYDFYIPELNTLIEYQGEFHDGNGNDYMKRNLESQQEHDRRKKEYAKLHNINILEIWYWDFDKTEEILESKLK